MDHRLAGKLIIGAMVAEEDFLIIARFEVIEIKPFWQTLQLGYVLKRASSYFRIFGLLEKLIGKIGLYRLPLRYNMGQSLLIARKRK